MHKARLERHNIRQSLWVTLARCPVRLWPPKILYNRWARKDTFARILIELAREGDKTDALMIEAPHFKAARTASSLAVKRGQASPDWAGKGGLNSKLHAVTDAMGRPIRLFWAAGNVSYYIDARVLMSSLSKAKWLLADSGLKKYENYAVYSVAQVAKANYPT